MWPQPIACVCECQTNWSIFILLSTLCLGRDSDTGALISTSHSCFRVCYVAILYDSREGNPCFPHRDKLCHMFLCLSTTSDNSNSSARSRPPVTPVSRLSRNIPDRISSVVTPGYSQSVIRDYGTAWALQTSACNPNLTQSHLAFNCPRPAQKMMPLISTTHSICKIRTSCPLFNSVCFVWCPWFTDIMYWLKKAKRAKVLK